jgi:hypothetical protein
VILDDLASQAKDSKKKVLQMASSHYEIEGQSRQKDGSAKNIIQSRMTWLERKGRLFHSQNRIILLLHVLCCNKLYTLCSKSWV